MSLLNSASLVVTPNGYKAGTLYSVIPNTTLGDMTVVRATTATRVNSAGLIESVANNVPRLDYPPLGGCPSLLVEPQRTNLMTFSQLFSNAIWTKDNSSLTSGFTSPSGAADAFKLIESATTAVHNIYISFASLTLGKYTTSIYIKKGERFKVAVADRNSGAYVSYNLNTGTIIDSLVLVGTIESLDNDWYRLTTTTTSTVSVYVPQFFILQDSYTTGIPITLPYLGDGTSGIYIWGSQLELGSYPTSYIPTTSAAVTRNADECRKGSISSLIGQSEGSLYGEMLVNPSGDSMLMWVRNSTAGLYGNFIFVGVNGTAQPRVQVLQNGIQQADIIGSALAVGLHKFAVGYKLNDFVFYVDGVQIGTASSGTVPTGMNELFLDQYIDGGIRNASKKEVVLFPTRLTNAELASLTT